MQTRAETPKHRSSLPASGSAGVAPRGLAFTLIELLVVIAIISVLAAQVLPALSRAKAQARKVQCLSEMKQWAAAFQMYVDDNEGWIPREGYHTNGSVIWNTWGEVGAASDVWYNVLPPYLGHAPAAAYSMPSKVEKFYDRQSFFHCPSARLPGNTGDDIAYFSRVMNSQLIEFAPTIKFDQIKDTARTALFLENRLAGEEKVVKEQDDRYLGQPAAYANRFAGRRHLRGGNLAFADGHVDWLPGEEVVETKGPNVGWAIVPARQVVWELDP